MTSLPAHSIERSDVASQLALPTDYAFGEESSAVDQPPHLALSAYYDLALYLRQTTGTPCVLDIGTSDASQLSSRFDAESVAVIGDHTVLTKARPFVPKHRLFLQDLHQPLSLPDSILAQSIVVCADALTRRERPEALLASLRRIAEIAPFVIIGSPDRARVEGFAHRGPPSVDGAVQHWRHDELLELLREQGMEVPLSGHIGPWGLHGERAQLLALSGTQCLTQHAPKKSVLALVSCYNDIDIIDHCYQHLKEQGVSVAFIDNWSKDGTWERIQELAQRDPNVCVYAEQFPLEGPSDDYEWAEILRRKAQLATQLRFDWYIHHDSDEIRESPVASLTLQEAISRVDALGYNVIDHTVLDFRPINDSFTGQQDPSRHFRYFEFGSRIDHFMQLKAWKRQESEVNLYAIGGHVVVFPEMRLYPFKFLLRHYSVRSPQHAQRKFFQHRLPRIKKEEETLRWHTHLKDEVRDRQKHDFLWDPRKLHAFAAEEFYSEYVLPRLTGIGIHEDNRLAALKYFTRS